MLPSHCSSSPLATMDKVTLCFLVLTIVAALVEVEAHPGYYRKPYYYKPSYYRKPPVYYKPPSYYSRPRQHYGTMHGPQDASHLHGGVVPLNGGDGNLHGGVVPLSGGDGNLHGGVVPLQGTEGHLHGGDVPLHGADGHLHGADGTIHFIKGGQHDAASDHDATHSETPVSTAPVNLPAAADRPVSPASTGDPDLDLAILLGETDSLPASPSRPTSFDVDVRSRE